MARIAVSRAEAERPGSEETADMKVKKGLERRGAKGPRRPPECLLYVKLGFGQLVMRDVWCGVIAANPFPKNFSAMWDM